MLFKKLSIYRDGVLNAGKLTAKMDCIISSPEMTTKVFTINIIQKYLYNQEY